MHNICEYTYTIYNIYITYAYINIYICFILMFQNVNAPRLLTSTLPFTDKTSTNTTAVRQQSDRSTPQALQAPHRNAKPQSHIIGNGLSIGMLRNSASSSSSASGHRHLR